MGIMEFVELILIINCFDRFFYVFKSGRFEFTLEET